MSTPGRASPGWGRTAWCGVEAGAALAFAYALAFIGYASARATLAILEAPGLEAGLVGSVMATCASLALPALVLAALAACPAALIGALSALCIRALLKGGAAPTLRRAVGSGLAVSLPASLAALVSLTVGLGIGWSPATTPSLVFWLVAPAVLYVAASGVAGWQLGRARAA